jgi:mRNA-degrading endonuclease toxin of MazEF toxin-antitoxin module
MGSIERGDVFLVNFGPTLGAEAKKTRPAVVVSNNINNAHSAIVSIAPITSNVRKVYSFEVEVPENTGGLRTRSKVMVNQTRTIDKQRITSASIRISSPLSLISSNLGWRVLSPTVNPHRDQQA